MSKVLEIALAISSASFAWYGSACFLSKRLAQEFVRYGLARCRRLTGALQIAASAGLVAGLMFRPVLLLSAGGLAAMMFLAVLTRLKIRDPLYAAIPAFALFVLNLFIFIVALKSR